MVAYGAMVRMAEATAVLRGVDVGAPVLSAWAHLRGADALAVLDVPVLANLTSLWHAGALTF